MKNFSKFTLLFLTILFSYHANSQTVGIKGGLNLSEVVLYGGEGDDPSNYSLQPGFHMGFTVDIPINNFLSFEPSFLFTTKGVKQASERESMGFQINGVTIGAFTRKTKSKTNLYYLEIPLALKASHQLGNKLRIFGAAGPYIGMGLSGKQESRTEVEAEGIVEVENTEYAIRWGNNEEENDIKRLDMGLTFGAGVEINAIMIGVSYDFGLYNISPYQVEGAGIENRVLKLSVGYRFGNQ